MIEPKMLKNAFTWTPKHLRPAVSAPAAATQAGLSQAPAVVETPRLRTLSDQRYRRNPRFGACIQRRFATADDAAIPVGSAEDYAYAHVQPGDAVKVDEYDMIFDSDFVLAVYIEIRSAKLGELKLASPAEKGGVNEAVLLWDSDLLKEDSK